MNPSKKGCETTVKRTESRRRLWRFAEKISRICESENPHEWQSTQNWLNAQLLSKTAVMIRDKKPKWKERLTVKATRQQSYTVHFLRKQYNKTFSATCWQIVEWHLHFTHSWEEAQSQAICCLSASNIQHVEVLVGKWTPFFLSTIASYIYIYI